MRLLYRRCGGFGVTVWGCCRQTDQLVQVQLQAARKVPLYKHVAMEMNPLVQLRP